MLNAKTIFSCLAPLLCASAFTFCTLEQTLSDESNDPVLPGGGNTGSSGNNGSSNGGSDNTTGDNSSAPLSLNAHIVESCDLTTFAGFLLTVHSIDNTCESRFVSGEETIHITVGESLGLPPTERTYNISSSEDIWSAPPDGEILAHSGSNVFTGGSLTIKQNGNTYEGSYDLRNDDDSIQGTFTSDVCLLEGTDCE